MAGRRLRGRALIGSSPVRRPGERRAGPRATLAIFLLLTAAAVRFAQPILVPIALASLADGSVVGSYAQCARDAGADAVVSTLVEARNRLLPWIQFAQNAPARPEPRTTEPLVA